MEFIMLLEFKNKIITNANFFDPNGNFRPYSYLDVFQNAAATHAEMLGLGADVLSKQNIAWILTKVKFNVVKSNIINQTKNIIISTYPRPKGRVTFLRDYYIHNDNNELLAYGSSQWVTWDISTRKIVPSTLDYQGEYTDSRAYQNPLEKIESFDDGEKIFSHIVQNSDIDLNDHTNNAKYAEMIYNAYLPTDKTISELIINYIHETKKGDTVDIFFKTDNDYCYFVGKCKDFVAFTARVLYI